MPAFEDIYVQPGHGKHEAIIHWRMAAGLKAGTFVIERSVDGYTNWSTIGQVVDTDFFIDVNFIILNRSEEWFYRVTRTSKGASQVSDVVSTFGRISREDFGISQAILQREFIKTRRTGTFVKVLRQLTEGGDCPKCLDPDTGQRLGTSLCDVCFGTTFKGGFSTAFDSYILEIASSAQVVLDAADGSGSEDPIEITARLPGFPQLNKNDLIVDPNRDRRFLVQKLDSYAFRNHIPIYFEGPLHLLRRSDIRYKVPV